ncbi:CapA family protein [Inediibacterium massiliense]|uniref:CapA family protein n=1 Tax=Inediibacterium massiliense TaxID=1658111 RepID=UPI0006B481A4|nr:CapA family protein [Inediibacterium massiliense]
MNKKILSFYLIFILCITACSNIHSDTVLAGPDPLKENISYPPPVEATILSVGDIMVHGPQLKAQYNTHTKEYDFNNNFQLVKPYIEKADLALCNLETTLGGPEKGYSSYPQFNSPDALGQAIKNAGFDVVVTANNHTMDTGAQGVLRTIRTLSDFQLDTIGTKEKEEIKDYIIKDVKGIKFGITAYTYEISTDKKNKALNGLPIPNEIKNCIHTFNNNHLEKNFQEMKNTVNKMKEEGVDVIIFYLHWGEEYHQIPNKTQKKIAYFLKDIGVDVIFGSHPHVLQPIEILENQKQNKKTLVLYSMGNFLSNQRYEFMKNRATEDGLMIYVTFKKDFEKNKTQLERVTYLPTWVNKYYNKGKKIYEIVPLMDDLDDYEKYHLYTKDSLWRAKNSKTNTITLIESHMNKSDLETLIHRMF